MHILLRKYSVDPEKAVVGELVALMFHGAPPPEVIDVLEDGGAQCWEADLPTEWPSTAAGGSGGLVWVVERELGRVVGEELLERGWSDLMEKGELEGEGMKLIRIGSHVSITDGSRNGGLAGILSSGDYGEASLLSRQRGDHGDEGDGVGGGGNHLVGIFG